MGSEVIQSRQDFFRVLDEAIAQISDRVRKQPKFQAYLDLEFQLDKMWRWTRDGRTPTDEERHSTDLGVIAIREIEPVETSEDQRFVTNLHELDYYFENWPDDPEVAAEDPPLE